MKISLELSDKEATKLLDQLTINDCGPDGYGWRSDELLVLGDRFRKAIIVSKKFERNQKLHPYLVLFWAAGGDRSFSLRKWVLASDSKAAKDKVRKDYSSDRNTVDIISARKQKMSKCAFFKKFGKLI